MSSEWRPGAFVVTQWNRATPRTQSEILRREAAKGLDLGSHGRRVGLELSSSGSAAWMNRSGAFAARWWLPDVFSFFLSFFLPVSSSLQEPKRGDLDGLPAAPRNRRVHTLNWHHLMSRHNVFKEKLHPFKPVWHVTARRRRQNFYLQFIADAQTAETEKAKERDMCKWLQIDWSPGDESSMYNPGGGRRANLSHSIFVWYQTLKSGKGPNIKGKQF